MPRGLPVSYHHGFLPGALGMITAWHGLYYGQVWGLSERFEAEVAREVAAFAEAYTPGRDLLLLARLDGRMVGSVVIDAGRGSDQARLRWFILDQAVTGHGIGGALLEQALAFCRDTGVTRVGLWTFAGLDAARRLYDRFGFKLAEELPYDGWGRAVRRQRLVLEP